MIIMIALNTWPGLCCSGDSRTHSTMFPSVEMMERPMPWKKQSARKRSIALECGMARFTAEATTAAAAITITLDGPLWQWSRVGGWT